VARVIRANWKVAQEAFCEAYHVAGTHPQILPWLGDLLTQVDVLRTGDGPLVPVHHEHRQAPQTCYRIGN